MTDQCVTAIAAVAQDVILLLTAGLIAGYLWETRKLRIVGQQQVEAQYLPAVVVRGESGQICLLNIGNGPALGIEWRLKDPGTKPVFSESTMPGDHILSYLEADGKPKTTFLEPALLVNRELHCLYRSISGQQYVSVSTFTAKGGFETYFHSAT
jgi:hypothetical protein